MYPNKKVHHLKDVIDSIWAKSAAIVQERKEALEKGCEADNQWIGGGKDIMSILRE